MSNINTVPDGHIIDFIDGKIRKDTPEEYVRQNIEKRLISEHSYSPEQIEIEKHIQMGSGKKRADIVIYKNKNETKQEEVYIIIECKSEKIESSNKTEGIEQLKTYMASCLNCMWGMWTNGKTKFVYKKIVLPGGKFGFEEPNDIPSKGRSISEIDRPTRQSLKHATEDNLLYAFKTCHNHIYVNDGLQKAEAFFELLKLIFCKILDERNIPHPLEFFASSSERLSSDGQLTVQKRINKIYEKVITRYPNIFSKTDEIHLKPVSLAYIVSELQKYSLLDTHIDVKGKAYEEIVGSNLRGDRGEFFTPRNIARMTVKMLDIPIDAKVLDPACGTGGFLVVGMNNVIKKLKEELTKISGKKEEQWNENEINNLRDKIKEIASQNFFGFDINPNLVKATKMNMVMNNDGSGNILQNNSLLPPHEWQSDIKDLICKSFNLEKNSIRRSKDLALFDFVVTNPPFGKLLPINDSNILEQFDLGHIWKKDKSSGKITKTDRIATSRPPEVLFIERCWQFLIPGGIMGIVLPDALLGAPGIDYASIREWIIEKCRIIASIDLDPDTFQPRNGTQTSVLFLQKKTEKEIQNGVKKSINYDIFFTMVDKIGHDKRGNPIYKRDKDGNEILTEDIISIDNDTQSIVTKRRVLDDQTDLVAETFLEWKKQEGLNWK